MTDRPTLLSFGHGYSARALAERLLPQDWHVIGTTRSDERAAEIRATGAEAALWPGSEIGPLLHQASHVLTSVSPDEDGDPVLRACAPMLAAEASRLSWVGYLSTTGVYGDREGGWVDEESACTPATRRGTWRLRAEEAWRALATESGLPLHIFRIAGIYGPGRGPFAKVRAGTARRIIKPGQVFSRIHVDDIASALHASIARPRPGGVYNLCDDLPAPPEDVITHAAQLLGVPPPEEVPIEQADLSPMARSFYAESKRVSNGRLREELGVDLRYPTYVEGLAAILETEAKLIPER
ncbi:MAG: SDR family oxidoreductase [Pseudomonadota bacterium]